MNKELFEKHLCNQNSHYENTDDFCYKGKLSRAITKSTLFAVRKDDGTQRRPLVRPLGMNCTYCSMPKGTCQAEVMSNSEKIKPIALAIIELCLSEGISQSVSQ